jgi:hypothetical protein
MRTTKLWLLTACLAGSLTSALSAQAPAPPPPAKYDAVLRYRIIAPRDQHALLYDRLIAELGRLGFEFQPPLDQRLETDRIDPTKNTLRGLIPSKNVAAIRDLPNVGGLLLVPAGMKLPDASDTPVRVNIQMAGGLPFDRQQDLLAQTALLLRELGFVEAPAYERRGADGRANTRLHGTIPAGQLEVLLKDLRGQPGGWFAPRILPAALPSPLREVNPLRWTEVLSDAEPINIAAAPAERDPAFLDKIGPGLWEIVEAAAKDDKLADELVRVQVLFAGGVPTERLRQLNELLLGAFVEGVLGNVVSAQVRLRAIQQIAAVPNVIAVRLPPPARLHVADKLAADFQPAKALAQSGLAALHQRGHAGRGVRVAVVDTDFRGWDALVQAKKLPPATRLVDLTVERSPVLLPLPALPGAELGHGTQVARAAAVAAPEAELVLIRIDGTDHFQIAEVARYLRGGVTSVTLDRRLDELRLEASLLVMQRNQLLKERQAIAENFADETELYIDFGFLGPVYGWLFSERDWQNQRMAAQERRERDHAERERRYWKLLDDIQGLKGIPLVVLPFGWNDEYPLGGASPLSRALDADFATVSADPRKHDVPPFWFVPTGNTAGQTWSGLFRDMDNNGAMEFVPPATELPPGRWTPEINFLAWRPHAGDTANLELPAKMRVRIALQWREPHDPDYYLRPGEEDYYRRSLAGLKLTLLRQRDPSAKTVAADAFEVVARSPELPGRLVHEPESTVYEQLLDFTVEQPGRYAVQIEHTPQSQWRLLKAQDAYRFVQLDDLKATGLRPLGTATLPAIERTWELQPRLFVDVLDEPSRRVGRPVLRDYATMAGSIGVPTDAHHVISVGAAGLDDQPRAYSAAGSPAFSGLSQRPTLYAYDVLREQPSGVYGTPLAAGFAAGHAAALVSSGIDLPRLHDMICREEGRLLGRAGK